jgi:hypothetical protein
MKRPFLERPEVWRTEDSARGLPRMREQTLTLPWQALVRARARQASELRKADNSSVPHITDLRTAHRPCVPNSTYIGIPACHHRQKERT